MIEIKDKEYCILINKREIKSVEKFTFIELEDEIIVTFKDESIEPKVFTYENKKDLDAQYNKIKEYLVPEKAK